MQQRWTIGLGGVVLCLSVVTLAIWIPRDVETGIVETFRRSRMIGDAMLPSMLALAAIAVSVLLIFGAVVESWRSDGRVSPSAGDGLTADNFRFLAFLLVALGVCLLLMYSLGPFLVAIGKAFGADAESYRHVRATRPWKYVGYMISGPLLVFALISFIEHAVRWRNLAIAIGAALVIAFLYDVPFDNLLLPPNGDF